MKEGLCSKKFPKKFVAETITGEDSYPKYRCRSPDDGGQCFSLEMKNGGGKKVEVDNQWVVPYSPLLLRLLKGHINVENCHSVKVIQYILKYINKGSNWATVQMKQDKSNTAGNEGNNANNPLNHKVKILNFQTG